MACSQSGSSCFALRDHTPRLHVVGPASLKSSTSQAILFWFQFQLSLCCCDPSATSLLSVHAQAPGASPSQSFKHICARPTSLLHVQLSKHTATANAWASLSTSSHSLTINNRPTITYVPLPESAHDQYDSPPTNYIQLIGALSKAKDLAKLQKLVDQYQDK